MKYSVPIGLLTVVLLCGAGGSCEQDTSQPTAAQVEAKAQNLQYDQILRNQPAPSFDWSLERHMLIEIYKARQRAVNTFSVVQSPYTGKVLWSCPSIGFPLPYATQLTNPEQVAGHTYYSGTGSVSAVAIPQQEPNGLFTPGQSDATWVPCVNDKGKITPVYEEKHVTVFFQPMVEVDGKLSPAPNSTPSLSIETARPQD